MHATRLTTQRRRLDAPPALRMLDSQPPPRSEAAVRDMGRARLPIKIVALFVRVLFRAFFRVRVRGLENVPDGPYIACANHLGWADMFLALLFLPVEPRIYVVGERQVESISRSRTRIIRWLGIMIALDRAKPREAVGTMEDVLRRGGSLLLFPEGLLGSVEGSIHTLQHGAAHLSVLSGAPILPVGLTGTSELWLRRKMIMRIGQAIEPHAFEGDARARTRAMTGALEAAMRKLLPGDRDRARVKLLRRWLTGLF